MKTGASKDRAENYCRSGRGNESQHEPREGLVAKQLTAFVLLLVGISLTEPTHADDSWQTVPIQSKIESVQPWTGMVLWSDNDSNRTDAIQLEYSYVRYDDIALDQGRYDWTVIDRLLDSIASRKHQAILRFYFVYPGKPTAVPKHIKESAGYQEITAKSEGEKTGFVDWSHPAIRKFTLDFYSKFASRYDNDPRLAYLETGFGLWAEYHIYDGPRKLGKTFPSKDFQAQFIKHLGHEFVKTPWMISVDAADEQYSPLASQSELLEIKFGLFDDSFLCKTHAKENAVNWRFFGENRWQIAPGGGELSYYNRRDQKLSLSPNGPHGESFEDAAARFHLSFMIGNDQLKYVEMDRIKQAGISIGYRIKIIKYEKKEQRHRITLTNTGVAPMYHDAFVAVGTERAGQTLRGLLPGESLTVEVESGGGEISITSDRLVDGQQIGYEADLQ